MCGSNNGKKALITGGSRGIGAGIALTMASEGYDITITYASKKHEAEEVAKKIEEQYKRKCVILQANLEEEDVPAKVVMDAVKALGEIHVLVNNAGVTKICPIQTMNLDNINLLINLDFKAYVMATQAVARHMIEKNIKGSIINITSSRGERAYPGDGVYGGVKAALLRATQSFALDLAPYGIRVNCVAPGATAVRNSQEILAHYSDLGRRIPLGRMGTPEDIGNAVAWLASDKASYITGVTLRVDGGLILPGMPEIKQEAIGQGWVVFEDRKK